jgi:hypothetical protein
MIRFAFAAALLLCACAHAPASAQSPCPPAGYDRAALDALKANDWAIADDAARNALARAMTACVADADPTMRDGIAFEGLQHWLRAKQLTPATMLALADDLEARLTAPEGAGFERPFAALILSEVARADRIAPYLSASRRAQLLSAATAYVRGVTDYRGFDATEGWRHGVAHGSDLLLQLALNPALGRDDLIAIRDAVETQIAPDGHFYIYGESERLARPILYAAQRGLMTQEEWSAWFARFATAGENPFGSQDGLARRHNVNAFLNVLYVNAGLSQDADIRALLPGVEAALRAQP